MTVIILFLAATTATASAAIAAPRSTLGVETDIALPKSITSIVFTDSHGSKHRLDDLPGVTLLVPFLSLCNDVCPFTTGNAIQVARMLESRHDSNVHVIEITVDPRRDTVRRLAAYRRMVGLGNTDSTISLWRATGNRTATFMKFFGITADHVKSGKNGAIDWMTHRRIRYEVDHSDGFYVLDSRHHIRYISGLSARFVGTLTRSLTNYLSSEGRHTLMHPHAGWTPRDAVASMAYVAKRPL